MLSDYIMIKTDLVPVLELRRLLFELKDLRPDICIRFRFIGEMWQNNHYRVLKLTEKGVVLNDERANKLQFVQDLNKVIQFELDQAFQKFQPHYHYSVDPLMVI
jgi:hypothetical protein